MHSAFELRVARDRIRHRLATNSSAFKDARLKDAQTEKVEPAVVPRRGNEKKLLAAGRGEIGVASLSANLRSRSGHIEGGG